MIDQIIVALYLVITLVIGLMVGRNTKTLSDFAIGKRDFSTIVLLSTIFASVVDGNGTLGLAEAVYSQGPAYCLAFLGIIFSYLGLAYFIAPRFGPFLGLVSSGDILGKLYGPRAKVFMGFAAVFESTMLTGVQILAMTHIIQYFFAFPEGFAAVGSTAIILLYSLRGGIRAVTATDVFQFGILIIAIPIICGVAIVKIGGFNGLVSAYHANFERALPEVDPAKYLAIFASYALPALFPLTIQRMLMAKNTKQISTTFLLTGILSLPFYIVVGCIALAGCVLMPNIAPNFVFPGLINTILPIGVKGFVIAGLLAVFMSSIDSSLNVAAVAVTHDIMSVTKNKIPEKTKLRIAKLSSIIISLCAVSIALFFNNIIDMMFFLLCVSNSAFFPGYLIGLLGFKPSRRGFWLGILTASLTVLVLTVGFGVFELYAGLLAILANAIVLVISDKQRAFRLPQHAPETAKPILNTIFTDVGSHHAFAAAILINAVGAFLIQSFFVGLNMGWYLALYFLSAGTAFLLLFRELWWPWARKFYVPLLGFSLMLSVPCLSVYMFLYSGCDKLWLFDSVISFWLLYLLTARKHLLLSSLSGIVLAVLFFLMTNMETAPDISALGNWSIVSHIAALTGLLVLFRKHDSEKYLFLSSKLAHEAARSLSSLSLSADYLKARLPELINGYEWAHQNGYNKTSINQEAIHDLHDLPDRLKEMGKRTAKTLDVLLRKIRSPELSSDSDALTNIHDCIRKAISDPSISKEQRDLIDIVPHNSFTFRGDASQVTQAIINIFENALHAIANNNAGAIRVWTQSRTLFIEDNGVGIAKKDLPSIFDDYFSTKGTFGEGLALCKQIMVEQGGSIEAVSEEGQFTRIELNFPPVVLKT